MYSYVFIVYRIINPNSSLNIILPGGNLKFLIKKCDIIKHNAKNQIIALIINGPI